jgi:hypothetical protein
MLIAALRQLKLDVARNPGALLAWLRTFRHLAAEAIFNGRP